MFECPQCGYKDPPCWRTSRYVIYAVYCTLDELEVWDPDLVAALRNQKRLERGPYYYYLRGRVPHVYRLHKELKDFARAYMTERAGRKHRPPDPAQANLKRFL